ncbi:hypothetical protein SLEP1_g26080 [Rubroshorea leprosula]|uniref:Uncharacterized protein n=1 Tax=Rubroshorea leprosula TaxID=152421 RepID=A0AAV5JNW2_9ROSI|nr:hypothetical protein SLEP1_g26080 [Rubroshorea leprosula]
MAIDPSASSSLPTLVFVGSSSADGVGTPLSSSSSEFFDVFCFPRRADGRFVVKGASCHVERDPVIPSILTEVPLVSSSEGGRVVLLLGSTNLFCDLDKVFPPQHPMCCATFQCLPPDMCVYKDQFACGLRFPLHPFILKICDGFSISLPQLAPRAIVDLSRMWERTPSSSVIQSSKESPESRAFAFSSSLGYFNLAVKLIKMLLWRSLVEVKKRLSNFWDAEDFTTTIHSRSKSIDVEVVKVSLLSFSSLLLNMFLCCSALVVF